MTSIFDWPLFVLFSAARLAGLRVTQLSQYFRDDAPSLAIKSKSSTDCFLGNATVNLVGTHRLYLRILLSAVVHSADFLWQWFVSCVAL